MAIKKLQNDYTTPEQSKRLLELGVPADSANFCLRRILTDDGYCETWIVDVFDFIGHVHDDYLPCWSVGRLMEIFDICCPNDEEEWPRSDMIKKALCCSYVEYLVRVYELAKRKDILDFSKLED